MFTMMHLDNLHVNNSFFLATFELGLCLAVSGDIPTAPLVSYSPTRFLGPLEGALFGLL